MDDSELLKAIEDGLKAHRGYADFDSWSNRPVRDLSLGRDFAEALSREFKIELGDLQVNPEGRDPPDLLASKAIGIELTELVDQDAVERAVRLKRSGRPHSQYRDWTEGQLCERLREIIAYKDAATLKSTEPLQEYWLVIHSAEPGLTPEPVARYLAAWHPLPCSLITRCFFLMSYFPGIGRPLFELPVIRRAT